LGLFLHSGGNEGDCRRLRLERVKESIRAEEEWKAMERKDEVGWRKGRESRLRMGHIGEEK
jgi:hypothetical protein